MATAETPMNKYDLAAVKAVALCRDNPGLTPPMAWERATAEYFVPGTPAHRKRARLKAERSILLVPS